MGNETVVNLAHDGRVSELTLRYGITLELISNGDNENVRAARAKRETGKLLSVVHEIICIWCSFLLAVSGGFLPPEPRPPILADYLGEWTLTILYNLVLSSQQYYLYMNQLEIYT